ncbi:hypothetical protein D3C73_929560 [compost metagenome]
MLTHFLKQARRHAAAKDIGEDLRTVEIAHMIGLALETEQDLCIHEVAFLTNIAADIACSIKDGRRAGRSRQTGKTFFHLFAEGLVVDRTGGHHEHPVGRIIARKVAANLTRREAFHPFRCAEDGATDRLAAIGDLGELVEDDIVGRVVGRTDFLQDHVFFAAQFFLVEFRLRQNVCKDIDRQRHMILEHARIIGCGFCRGRRIQLSPDILDLLGDVAGAAPCCSLEGHVLEQMGDAMLFFGLVARTRLDPHAECHAFQMWHAFGDDSQPGGEPGNLYIHTMSFRRAVTWSVRCCR